MSLLLIPNPPDVFVTSTNWATFLTRSNGNMLGHGLSIPIFTLTNWDASTTIPEITEGSIIEVGGSFYQADADTALTPEGGIANGTVHIKLVPAGGGASVVPTLTNDSIPAWDGNKAGWYDSDDKFLPFEMVKASAVYTLKGEYKDQQLSDTLFVSTAGVYSKGIKTDTTAFKTKVIEIGSWDMDTVGSKNVAHGISDYTKIRSINAIIRNDADTLLYPINTVGGSSGTEPQGNAWAVNNSGSVLLMKVVSGVFDNTSFNDSVINRGWLTIVYEA